MGNRIGERGLDVKFYLLSTPLADVGQRSLFSTFLLVVWRASIMLSFCIQTGQRVLLLFFTNARPGFTSLFHLNRGVHKRT